jgi:Spy/CpxP family protein refolding chaperone
MELKKNAHNEMKASKEQYQKLRADFKEAMKDSKATNLDLTTKYEAVAKAREDFQAKRFQMMLKMREVLTPAQMEKFQDIRKKFKDKFYGKGKKKK